MDQAFYKLLSERTAHRISREFIRDYVFQHPEKLQYLMEIGLNEKDKIHIKACWSLELIFEIKLELILPYINEFLEKIGKFKIILLLDPFLKYVCFYRNQKL